MAASAWAAGAPATGQKLADKIAQLLVVRFDGPSLSSDARIMIRRQHVGGVALYAKGGNIADERQLTRLIAAMQRAAPRPLLIAIDQEGGRVDRLAAVRGTRPSAAAIAATGDVARAAAAGGDDAAALARLGIGLNLAPVVDVTNVYNWQLDERTFGTEPGVVTRMAGAYLAGLQADGRVIGALKHFPGLGAVSEDPHQALPRLARARADLEAIDWAPYRDLIARGDVRAVLVSHVVVEAIDATEPATRSPALVTGILRRALHFDGVIIADSLKMKGAGTSPIGDAALAALRAGADCLLGPESSADVAAIVDRVTRAVADGTLEEARLDRSLARLAALRPR